MIACKEHDKPVEVCPGCILATKMYESSFEIDMDDDSSEQDRHDHDVAERGELEDYHHYSGDWSTYDR